MNYAIFFNGLTRVHKCAAILFVALSFILTNQAAAQTISVCASGCDYASIQDAVNAATSGATVNVSDGTYNERVEINKSLTLSGQSEAGTIVDGTGFPNGRGISIVSGVTDVTIENLTVQNFSGSNGNSHAGIYGIGGNNNLTVQHVTIQNNVGGSGFYANGSITDVLLDHVTSSGHTSGARGIVIWNGLKSNITITNCEVFNNNCCGIELQDGDATGVTLTNNNVYDNGDNGIGLTGLAGPNQNLVSNNSLLNNGRFGIEIKNPNGFTTVSGNTVSRTVPISDQRDIMGIGVFRRGVLNNNADVPTDVVVSNNTVSGYTQSSTSDGFGIVIEGLNHTVTGNTLTGNDVGIQQQAGHTPYPGDGNQANIADDYFGRGNSPITCGNEISGNTYSGNGTDTRNVGAGGGLVTNTNTLETFCSIQAAIDDPATLDGHTITLAAGIYDESVLITKKISLLGPNSAISAVNGTRVPEARLLQAVRINEVANVTVSGFEFFEVSTVSNWTIYIQGNSNSFTFDNNRFIDIQRDAIRSGISSSTGDITVTGNLIEGMSTTSATGLFLGGINGTSLIANNKIDLAYNGNPTGYSGIQTPNATGLTISGNEISNTTNQGLQLAGTCGNVVIENNYIFNANTSSGADKGAIRLYGTAFTGPITITGNTLTNSYYGVAVKNGEDITGKDIVIENNDLSGNSNAAIYNGASAGTLSATCNWYGTTDVVLIADAIDGDVVFMPYLLSDDLNTPDCSGSGPVVNVTQNISYFTIQAAIDDASAGDVIEVSAGTYEEGELLVNKSLKLQGANAGIAGNGTRAAESVVTDTEVKIDAANVTFDGFKLTGTPTFTSGYQGAISKLNYPSIGMGADAVIKNNFFQNIGFFGILLEGVSGWTIEGNLFQGVGNGNGSLGTSDYSAMYLLQTTNLTIKDNIVNTVDYNGILCNDVQNASITGNSFTDIRKSGLQISGVAGDVIVTENTFTNANIADGFDRGAIRIYGQDFDGNVNISGNVITGGVAAFAVKSGQNITGKDIHFNNNSITGSTSGTAIRHMGTGTLDATCNWYGTAVSADVTAKISGQVNYSPFLSDGTDDDAGTFGFQPVPGSCTGCIGGGSVTNTTTGFTYCSIQEAIDDPATLDGHTITLAAGIYDESVLITKEIALMGPNSAISAVTGTRVTEARLLQRISINQLENVTVSGFEFFEVPTTSTWTIYIQGASNNFTFENNRFIDITKDAIRSGITSSTGNITVKGNLIEGMTDPFGTGILLGGIYGTSVISDNKIDLAYGGNPTGYSGIQTPSANGLTISGNEISNTTNQGLQLAGTCGNVVIENNYIFNTNTSNGAGKGAIRMYGTDFTGPITITGNILTSSFNGVAVKDGQDITGNDIVIENNDLSGNSNAAIYNGASAGTLSATCNWYGTIDVVLIADAIDGDVVFMPYLLSDDLNTPDCSGSGPVVNVTQNISYFTIQAAIDDANAGDVIEVSAGTYPENVTVTEEVDLRGPNYNISPNSGTRVAEAIVVPALTESDNVFLIEASNVKINGLTIDGDNTNVTTNWIGTNGADIDAADGIAIYDPNNVLSVNNTKIENNIFQNLAYFGVDNFGWYNYANPPTSGHLVKDNLFQDLGLYNSTSGLDYWGGAVLLYNDNYTRIVDNVMTNVRAGIQTGNFHSGNPGTADFQEFSNNTIEARRRGIFYNLHTGANISPFTISNNVITALADANEMQWDGILASSLSHGAGIISDNIIDGSGATVPSEGIEVWNVHQNAPVEIIGGEISNVDVGIFLNNFEGYNANGPNGAHANIQGVNVDAVTGMRLLDSPNSTTNGSIGATISGCEISASGEGVVIEETATGTVSASINGNSITGWSSLAINSSVDNSIDAACNWYGTTDAILIADAIDGDVVFEPYLVSDDLDTPNCSGGGAVVNVTQNTSYFGIQVAIDAANSGDEIIVTSGSYDENLTINIALTLSGANAGSACNDWSQPATILAPSSGLPISVTADGVTVDGFEITAPDYQSAVVCGNTSNLNIVNNNIHDIGTNVSGNHVHAVNYIVANASSTSNVNVSDNCFNNIGNDANHQRSTSAIGVLQSTSTGDLTNLTIERNSISNINAKTADWGSGGRIANGISINVGGNGNFLTNGKVVNAKIRYNTIAGLEGYISTAIGLEGNTQNAVVKNNNISDLIGYKTSNRAGGGFDLSALKFENNRYVGTVQVEDNSFQTNTFTHNGTPGLGYAVSNYVTVADGGSLELTCNWFGTALIEEIEDNNDLDGKILNKDNCQTEVLPALSSDTDSNPGSVGFDPAGDCILLPYASYVFTPSVISAAECDEFSVLISVETNRPVQTASLALTFDPNELEVLGVTTVTTPLPLIVPANWNNTLGTLTYTGSHLGQGAPDADFDLIQVNFKALGSSGTTLLEHALTGIPASQLAYVANIQGIIDSFNILLSAESLSVILSPDITAPIASCQNITIQLDNSGSVSITPEDVNSGSSDNCGVAGLTLTLDQSGFDCSDIGVNTVILTVTDANGNFDTCTATVTVENALSATITCPSDLTFYLDASACVATAVGTEPGVGSNCDASFTYQISGATTGGGVGDVNGIAFNPGLSTVTYTATQGGDNCSFEVFVQPTQDAVSCDGCPSAPTYGTTLSLPIMIGSGITNENMSVGDYCDFELGIKAFRRFHGDIIPVGDTYQVGTGLSPTDPTNSATDPGMARWNYIFSADLGNYTFEDVQVYLEVDFDPANPSATGPYVLDVSQFMIDQGFGALSQVQDSQNLGFNFWQVIGDPNILPFDPFAEGVYEMKIWVESADGVELTYADMQVEVDCQHIIPSEDIDPSVLTCPANLSATNEAGSCEAEVSFSASFSGGNPSSTITYLVGGNPISSPHYFPVGTTIVVVELDNGCDIVNCNFEVEVIDNEVPTITCAVDGSRVIDQPNATYEVQGSEFDPVSIGDNCTAFGNIAVTHNAGLITGAVAGPNSASLNEWQLPEGVHDITYTAEDEAGNTASCVVQITIETMVLYGNILINQNCMPIDVRVRIYNQGTSVLIEEYVTSADIAGNFTVALSGVGTGYYDIFIKAEKYLQQGLLNENISGMGTTISVSSVIPGDVSGGVGSFNDNTVNSLDLSLVLVSYNALPSDPVFNPKADLNCSGSVDGLDLSIISFYFSQYGDTPTP